MVWHQNNHIYCVSQGFDIRIAPTEDLNDFKAMMEEWLKQAGEGITYEFVQVSCPMTFINNMTGFTAP